jgi:hypothetical protein
MTLPTSTWPDPGGYAGWRALEAQKKERLRVCRGLLHDRAGSDPPMFNPKEEPTSGVAAWLAAVDGDCSGNQEMNAYHRVRNE